MLISPHGKQRVRKRLGLPAKAVKRQAQRAFERGDLVYEKPEKSVVVKAYNKFMWVFSVFEEPMLVTVHHPKKKGDVLSPQTMREKQMFRREK